ncbi:MAG: GNAT family N-acetyltransferase [Promethearchaeota archaeon]
MIFRNLTHSDLDFALELIKLVGWGTSREELEDLLDFSSKSAFLAVVKDKPVGMIFTVSYNKFGFIGDLIVKEEFRNQGIGKQLMQKAINHLEKSGNTKIMLDGVQDAVRLYRRLGFKVYCKSLRLNGDIKYKPSERVFQMENEDFEEVLKLDLKYFQANREFLLNKLFRRNKSYCKIIKQNKKITGFIMAIPKQHHLKIGPWIVDDENELEPELLLENLNNKGNFSTIQLGMLESNKYAHEIAKKCGLNPYFYSFRMIYTTKPQKKDTIQFKRGMLAIGGPDRG